MLIMLLHMDPATGLPHTTTLEQSPRTEYQTQPECERAAELKRTAMLKSSRQYPDLNIVNIRIECVAKWELEFDPDFIQI